MLPPLAGRRSLVKFDAVSIIGLLGTPLVARGLPRVARLLVVRGEIVAAVRARCKRNRRPSPRRFEGVKPGVASSSVASRWAVERGRRPDATPLGVCEVTRRVVARRLGVGCGSARRVVAHRFAARWLRSPRRSPSRRSGLAEHAGRRRHSPLATALSVERRALARFVRFRTSPVAVAELFSPLRSLRLCGEPRPVVRRPLSAQRLADMLSPRAGR